MRIKTKKLVGILAVVTLFSNLIFLSACSHAVDQEQIVGSGDLRLRIIRWPGFFLSYNYAIEYSKNNRLFKNVHKWSQDDPFPLPDFTVNVIDSEKAYFLTYDTFGVTLNRGDKWLIYKPWEVVKYQRMPKAEITDDGVGEIFLPAKGTLSRKTMFTTKDFGVSWTFVGYD